MKKLFTLFAAALVGVSAFAFTEGNTKLVYTVAADQDPAATEITVDLQNSNDDLNAVQQGIIPEAGVEFIKTGTGMNKKYFWPNAAYILAMFPDATDEDRVTYFGDFANNEQAINGDRLVVVLQLKTNECWVYPAYDGNLGYFTMNLSALEDGNDILVATLSENPEHSNFADASAVSHNVERTEIRVNKANGKVGPVVVDAISVVDAAKNVTSVKYFNLQGVESATPFDGVNIMVKTYEDGTKTTSKLVK